MSYYYDEMLENILKEAMTEEYWSVERAFGGAYDDFRNKATKEVDETVEIIMESYHIVEAKFIKEMYLRGAYDLEVRYRTGVAISDSLKEVGQEYEQNRLQIHYDIRKTLKKQEDICKELDKEQFAVDQLRKIASSTEHMCYKALMKKISPIEDVERRCMYMQGALDRARMIS